MPTVGSLKVLIEGDMRPYLVTVRQADEATKGLTRRMGRDVPDALRRANRATDESTKSLAGMAASAMQAYKGAVALAGAWGAARLVQGINDFARTAHQAEAGGVVFAKMLDRVGESVREVRPELQSLADELKVAPELIQSNAAELLRAGYTWEQIGTIYRGAGASALLAGKSTAEGVDIATDSLVSGLSTYLNQIGITQNLSTAYTQYARELGTTAERLSDAERAQAATLMIQKATAQEVQDMPVLLQGYGGAVSDLSRLWYDFKVALGTLVLPAVNAVLRALSALLAPIISVVNWLRQMRGASREAADAVLDLSRGSLDHARATREQADELSTLLDRYEELASISTRSVEEQAEIEQVMSDIADIQPGLVSGYRDMETAIRDNIQPLRDYAEALKNASDIELEIAARRAQLALPSLREDRDRVIAERDALIGQNREQFLQAQRLQTLAAEATRLFQRMATAPLSSPEQLQARRELERFLSDVFPGEFEPGFDPALMDFTLRLQEMARESMAAFGGVAAQIEELDRQAKSLEEQIRADEMAVKAFDRAQQGLDPFPTVETGGGGGTAGAIVSEVEYLVSQARLRMDAMLRGLLQPRGVGADFRLLDQETLDQAERAAEAELIRLGKELADAVARERERVQRLLAGEQTPTSWAQLRLYDEGTLQDGLDVAEQFLDGIADQVAHEAEQSRIRLQLVLDGTEAPTSWAALKLLDESTLQQGAEAANRVLGEIADQVAEVVRQERLRLQRVLEGKDGPTSWAQLKMLDEATLQQGAEAATRVLEDAVRYAWEQAQMVIEAIQSGRLPGTAPGHFRILENLSMDGAIDTSDVDEELDEFERALRRAEAALGMFSGALPGVQEAIEAYRQATKAASAGGLGLSAAGGAAAAALAFLIANSEGLSEAFDAVAAGLAALLAPLDALLEMLGPKVSGALVGAAAGAAAGSIFGPAGMIAGGIIGGIAGWLGGAAQDQATAAELLQDASAAIREAAEDWREFVQTAPLHELFSEMDQIERRRADQERIRDLTPPWLQRLLPDATGVEIPQEILDERKRIAQQIKDIEKWGVWPWERDRYEGLKDALREVDEQIREFQEGAAQELEDRIREALGIGWRELASGVRSAFDEATLGDFTGSLERELKMKVRNALITAFLESAAMAPLFESLSDAIMEAVRDGVLSAGELDAIEDIISEITDNSAAFYEVLDELGLSMEDLTDATNSATEALRNVPRGFKIALRRFDATVPAFGDGAVVTEPTVAWVGDKGPGAVIPLDRAGMGTVINVEITGPVYGMDDFDRRVQEAVAKGARRARMATYGLARG